MGENINVYKIVAGKPEWKRPLSMLRCRWEENIKMDLREIWWKVVDWTPLAQDKEQWHVLVNMV
jgi:hypothetical protein